MDTGQHGRRKSDAVQRSGLHFIFPVLLLLAVSMAFGGLLLIISAERQDTTAAVKSRGHARAAIDSKLHDIATLALDIALDSARRTVTQVKRTPASRGEVADDHITAHLTEPFSIAAAYTVAANGQTINSVYLGKSLLPGDEAFDLPEAVRSFVSAAIASPDSATKPIGGLAEIRGVVSFVGVARLRASRPEDAPDAGSALVLVREINEPLLEMLAATHQLRSLRLTDAPLPDGYIAIPLIGVDDSPLKRLAWLPDTPGRDLLIEMIPAIALALGAMAVLTWLFVRQAWGLWRERAGLYSRLDSGLEALRTSEERHREFLANAAHELRTPLALFRSHLDSLSETEATKSLRDDVDKMARLVEQLLAMARLESRVEEEAQTTDIGAICVSIASDLAPLAIKEGRLIEVIGNNDPINVLCNPDAIAIAVRNLVENALKYSRRGTTVTIKIEKPASISVIDCGGGIPDDVRAQIFDRFQRFDRRGGGAGLGLAIVKRAIDAHNGTIEITDNPLGGSQFTIRLET